VSFHVKMAPIWRCPVKGMRKRLNLIAIKFLTVDTMKADAFYWYCR